MVVMSRLGPAGLHPATILTVGFHTKRRGAGGQGFRDVPFNIKAKYESNSVI